MRGRGLYIGAALLGVAGVVMLVVGLLVSRSPVVDPAATATASTALPETADEFVDVPLPAGETPVAEPSFPEVEVVPTRVRIPAIDVDATVIDLGLTEDRRLEVPEDISVTGWYTGRSVPGEDGPSVVVGHVDSRVAGKGVFYSLGDLVEGDTVEIERSDGTIAAFRVTDVSLVPKDEFPTEQVYGSTPEPTLRLITCGGTFDRSVRSYEYNVIVFAEFLGTRDLPVTRS
jgi:sortase (surface protein transpeptidase)